VPARGAEPRTCRQGRATGRAVHCGIIPRAEAGCITSRA
jgi:hypothetical protein